MNQMRTKLTLIALFVFGNVVAQDVRYNSFQNMFKAGKIISLKDNIACYRKNGLKNNGSYGYCMYDSNYEPKVSFEGASWSKGIGDVETYTNSQCYTIIAPVFDYAHPFSDGWGAVCKDKKWSYVSLEGDLMCDFVLDAAYPFKNGSAKIIYNGKSYEIDRYGHGLPQEINRDTRVLSRKYKALAINQLYEEKQLEKAIEKGNCLYKEITSCQNGQLFDVTANELIYAIQAEYAALSSQNSLMAILLQKPQLFDYYQDLKLERRLSSESGLYGLSDYNSKYYLDLFVKKHASDTLVNRIIDYVQELDYKSAILLFEKWKKNNSISLDEHPLEIMVYFYLAELSNDFETANHLLLSIAELYEKEKFVWIQDKYLKGCLLLNIRRYQSAEKELSIALKEAKQHDDYKKEVICNYSLAILYSITDNSQQSLQYYQHSLKLLQKKQSNASIVLKNEIMSSYLDFLLNHNLWGDKYYSLFDEYVKCEIDYNSNFFISNDLLHVNRLWGKSLSRFQKVLQHLDDCTNDYFLNKAFLLSAFMQSIASDSEKLFLSSLKKTQNDKTKSLVKYYLQLKREFKGFDLFDVGESNLLNKEQALKINMVERDIRSLLIKEGLLKTENHYINLMDCFNNNDVVIDVVEYTVNSVVKKYGAFIANGTKKVLFVSLGKENRFESSTFWSKIMGYHDFNKNNKYYLFAGKLDGYGLEYEKTSEGNIAYLSLNLHRISSMSAFKLSNPNISLKNIALYGGLDYGEELTAKSRGAIESGYLEYSKKEIDEISEIVDNKMIVEVYSSRNGTTDSFLSHDGRSPNIIHLATHGYQKDLNTLQWSSIEGYFNQDRFNYYRQNTDVESLENLLSNTGLFFSVSDNDTINVLYSREIASCDLSSSKLIILSACNTLSGKKSDNYSGSIGLTTAFIIAQAQNIITSLHDVDDEKTYEFMIKFYTKLRDSEDIYNSFKSSVSEMRHNYPNNRDVWGAFVLLESSTLDSNSN